MAKLVAVTACPAGTFSIADRPGLTPGLVGGMLAVQLKAGFLGGSSRASWPAIWRGGCATSSSCRRTSRA